MKKSILTLTIIATLVSPCNVYARQTATRTMSGKFITRTLIQTKDGDIWEVSKKYKPGKKVKVIFDTRHTKTKKDDRIIKIK